MTIFLVAREDGLIETVQGVIPESLIIGFVLVTHLGSIPVLFGIATMVYWMRSRRIGGYLIGIVLGAIALTMVLKSGFALSRPPETFWLIDADGFGFPSGHAIAASATGGAFAQRLDFGTRQQRVLAAATLVGLIGLSRIILGIHYVIDVVVGIAVGILYLGFVTKWSDFDAGKTLGLAALIGVGAVWLTGSSEEAVLLAGIAIGSFATWRLKRQELGSVGIGIPSMIGGVMIVGSAVGIGYLELTNWPTGIDFGLGLFAGVIVIGWPIVTEYAARGSSE